MIDIVIQNLKNIKNPVSDKLITIFEGKQEKVSDNFYSQTFFETQKKYSSLMDCLSGDTIATFNKPIVDTPLVFTRSKYPCVTPSIIGQGVDFGVVMVDYVSNIPYIVLVAEKSSNGYRFKSLTFDVKTKTYSETSTDITCSNYETLSSSFKDSLGLMINKYKTI